MTLIQDQLAILSGGRDRRGGPIITFPASGRREKAKSEDYRLLLQYLMTIPNEEVAALGFTVIVDMRGNTTWSSVKPILKVLQESFAMHIHTAHIIKPDNFWQKQRTSLGSQKYKFETNLISTEALLKVLEPTQLSRDLDGSLLYEHSIWIELRYENTRAKRLASIFPFRKITKNFVKLCLLSIRIMQNSFHSDEIFYSKKKKL